MSNRRRVVITGMGIVSPLGCTIDGFWGRLVAGETGIGPIQRWDPTGFDVRFAGECLDFDPSRCLNHRAAKRIDRYAQMAVVAASDAYDASGLKDGGISDPYRFGVITGSGVGGLQELEEQCTRLIQKGPTKVSAFTIPKLMANAGSGNISILLGAKGPNLAVVTACASATHAMGAALHAIQRDDVDVMITGGAEAAVTKLGMSSFASMKALSSRNDDPQRASRPFDRDRDGFVMGEGAGMFVFEEMEHAKKRGADILGEVLGVGMSGDAGHLTQPDEDGAGAAAAMRAALAFAGVSPDQVGYINAHGTGTPLGDVAESAAIKTVFGVHAYELNVSSTKSSMGHLLGASGGVELVVSLMAIRHGVAPPTINLENPGEGCDLNYTSLTAQDLRVDVAMSNSFGFGGHNASVVIGRFR